MFVSVWTGKKHRRNLNILDAGLWCRQDKVLLQAERYAVQYLNGNFRPERRNRPRCRRSLEKKGYEVRVLDLINMQKSYCYNPFVYLGTTTMCSGL